MQTMATCGSIIRACVCVAVGWVMMAVLNVVDAKTVLDPTGMVNLNKNQAFTNSLLCLQNTTVQCPVGYVGESGNINPNNTASFCTDGCLNQTLVMLKCIDHVYTDFRFNNKGTTNDLRAALNKGCTPKSIFYGNFTVIPSDALSHAKPNALLMVVAIASIIYTSMKV